MCKIHEDKLMNKFFNSMKQLINQIDLLIIFMKKINLACVILGLKGREIMNSVCLYLHFLCSCSSDFCTQFYHINYSDLWQIICTVILFYIFLSNISYFQIDLFEPQMRLYQIVPLEGIVDQGVMARKEYFTVSRAIELEQCSIIPRISLRGGLTPL